MLALPFFLDFAGLFFVCFLFEGRGGQKGDPWAMVCDGSHSEMLNCFDGPSNPNRTKQSNGGSMDGHGQGREGEG